MLTTLCYTPKVYFLSCFRIIRLNTLETKKIKIMGRKKKFEFIEEEDWDEQIRKERERAEKGPSRKEWILIMEEIEKQREPVPNACRHRKKFWFYETHPQLLCKECFVVLEEKKIMKNDVGYGFRNHIKNGRKAK